MSLIAERSAPPRWRLPVPLLIGAVCLMVPLAPLMAVLVMAAQPSSSWDHVADTVLWGYVRNTALLILCGGGLAVVIGTACAWLVTSLEFPGRGVIGWALVLPFALPPYIAAYAWGDLLGARGPAVAVLVFATTLYPYAYLAARAGFTVQSVCAQEAARSLGAGPWRRFFRVALPMARASIVAGGALAALEIMGDFGAADHLGVPTLAVGVFRTWFAMGDLSGAARLAVSALAVAGLLLWLERRARRGMLSGGSVRWRSVSATPLTPAMGLLVVVICLFPVVIGLCVPVAHLAALAVGAGPPLRSLGAPVLATAGLALAGAAMTLLLALTVAALSNGDTRDRSRHAGGQWSSLLRLSLLSGYATPGAVLALGLLATLALIGPEVAAMQAGSAGLVIMVMAYAARFGGAAFEPIEAGLQKTTTSMRDAAASLGAGGFARFVRIDAPIALPSVFAAALIVAVEVAKELPATLILRPFGLDTLAVRAHAYAADERLASAAWPALMIVALALLPTMLMTRAMARARAGYVDAPASEIGGPPPTPVAADLCEPRWQP